MYFDIKSIEKTHWKTKEKFNDIHLIPHKITSKSNDPMKMIKEGPLPVYLWGGLADDPNEMYSEPINQLSFINIMVGAISEEVTETTYCFFINVKVEWVDDMMKIVPGSASLDPVLDGNSDIEGIAFFADRASAMKFKKLFLTQENLRNMIDGMDDLREFFMEYSSAEEWDNFFKVLQSINTNNIYQ